jgi:hypothetical protein
VVKNWKNIQGYIYSKSSYDTDLFLGDLKSTCKLRFCLLFQTVKKYIFTKKRLLMTALHFMCWKNT